MNERIHKVRKYLGLTLEEFGKRLGVTKTTISRLENGVNSVTEQMLLSICREFGISEEWLRSGEGEMFASKDIAQHLTDWINKTIVEDPSSYKLEFITNLISLSDEEWETLKKLFPVKERIE